jgi:hypothetical protein
MAAHRIGGSQEAAALIIGRAVGPRLMSGCGAGSRATCSAALFGALEAYPPVGTTPGVPGGGGGAGGGLPGVYEIVINPHTRFWLQTAAVIQQFLDQLPKTHAS